MSSKYALTEILTTGLNFKKDRIIHLSSYIIEDNSIISKYTSFINPNRILESEWRLTTGINDSDLVAAPQFFQIARDLLALWDDAIIISSNPRLTYTFIKNEYKSLGYDFNHSYKRIDENITSDLDDIPPGIHKAENLAKLFLANGVIYNNAKNDLTPRNFLTERIKELPNTCGIYILKNKDGTIIYVGKAIKIRTRIRQHFRNLNNKGFKIHRQVAEVDFQETKSELFALLFEHFLILKYKPELNKALRNEHYEYEIRYIRNVEDYHEIVLAPIEKIKKGNRIRLFRTRKQGINYLSSLVENQILHPEIINIYRGSKMKWAEYIDQKLPHHHEYNETIGVAVYNINPFYHRTFVINERGYSNEYCIIEKGKFYGFSLEKSGSNNIETLKKKCLYIFDSNYALNLLTSYHYLDRLNIREFDNINSK